MRYLGIDYGTRKTGLALSDEAGTMGFPHAVVPTVDLERTLEVLIPEKKVECVVIGESRNLDGSENAVAAGAKAFAAHIEESFKLPVAWEPEMFTSAEARRMHEPEAKSRAPRSRADVDASAAALILTSYLSRTHGR
jgi:putative Holliday junction resolvase